MATDTVVVTPPPAISVTATGPDQYAVTITAPSPIVVDTGLTGQPGPTGATGATGPGVASGGATSTVLVKASATDYDTAWTAALANITSIAFNTSAGATASLGKVVWDDTNGTLGFGLKGGNVTLQIGQELVQLVKEADNLGLADGKAVYVTGSDGANMTVKLAQANAEVTSATTIGVMTEATTGGNKGFMTTYGLVHDINTSTLTEGAVVWLSPSVAGGMTTTKPVAPDHTVMIGVCVRQHAVNGHIFVMPNNGYELGELHDVLITAPANNDVLTYKSATGLWVNQAGGSGSGTVSSITFSAPLTGGTVTTTGTVGLDQTALTIAESQVTNLVSDLSGKQATLVSGTNIKTVNSTSLLGSGDLAVGTVTGTGTAGKVAKFTGTGAIGDSVMAEDTGRIGIGTTTFLDADNLLRVSGTSTASIQLDVTNLSNGTSASSDLIATADTGTNTTNYIDVGINSSTYNDAAFTIGGSLSGYLYCNGGDLTIGTQSAAKVIKLHTGGTLAANLRQTIADTGTQSINLIGQPQVQVNNQTVPDGYAASVVQTYTLSGVQTLTIQGNGLFAVL